MSRTPDPLSVRGVGQDDLYTQRTIVAPLGCECDSTDGSIKLTTFGAPMVRETSWAFLTHPTFRERPIELCERFDELAVDQWTIYNCYVHELPVAFPPRKVVTVMSFPTFPAFTWCGLDGIELAGCF